MLNLEQLSGAACSPSCAPRCGLLCLLWLCRSDGLEGAIQIEEVRWGPGEAPPLEGGGTAMACIVMQVRVRLGMFCESQRLRSAAAVWGR